MRMLKNSTNKVFVIGHKNPDTDSICSAICYGRLKNSISKDVQYIAKRVGTLNTETEYVLERFGVEERNFYQMYVCRSKMINYKG